MGDECKIMRPEVALATRDQWQGGDRGRQAGDERHAKIMLPKVPNKRWDKWATSANTRPGRQVRNKRQNLRPKAPTTSRETTQTQAGMQVGDKRGRRGESYTQECKSAGTSKIITCLGKNTFVRMTLGSRVNANT